jgi:hypothetical protein
MGGMVIVAILVAGIAATFTDWLFMGVLFHDRYNRYPEVWREGVLAAQDRSALIYSCALDFVAAACFIGICVLADIHTLWPAVEVALLAGIAGPVVITITNGLFMKLDWAIVAAHSAGYMVRFLLAAIAVAIFL